MTLADTSAWINHLRRCDETLSQLLADEAVAIHPFVVGELAGGTLPNRAATLADFAYLPQTPIAAESEVHHLLEAHRLWEKGLGWVDLHLLTAAILCRCNLLTDDRRLREAAQKLGIAYPVQ